MYKNAKIIIKEFDTSLKFDEISQYFINQYQLPIELMHDKEENRFSNEEILFLWLDDTAIKRFLKRHAKDEINLAILPKDDASQAITRYGIAKDIHEAIDEALSQKWRTEEELLLCNGEVVFKKVSIGSVDTLGKDWGNSWLHKIKNFFKNFKNIKYHSLTIKTANDKSIKTASSGILVLEDYTASTLLNTPKDSSFHDGNLNAFIIAPLSLLSYLYDLGAIFIHHRYSMANLPSNIGFITTKKLEISANQPLDFKLDNALLSAKEIVFEIIKTSINLHFGKSFAPFLEAKESSPNTKEEVRIAQLPQGEINDLLVKGKIPFFKKASDEDIKETLLNIKEASKINVMFIALMILSTLLATVGIFQNSTPTVVGAMILAPLMSPIVSLAMGLTRSNKNIIRDSIKTLIFGIFCALFFSSLVAMFMPLHVMTAQISSRLNPNLLDLLVAIFSGIAGAYAASKEQVAKSVAGVAIAVALVPPLAVSGIGIGWLDSEIVYGSFLLFLTNLFGVCVAGSITFIVLGFAPIDRAKKGLFYSTILLGIVTIPLFFSFYSLVLQNSDYSKLSTIQSFVVNDKKVHINIINIKSSNQKQSVIELEILSSHQLSDEEFHQIRERVEQRLGKKIIIEAIPKILLRAP